MRRTLPNIKAFGSGRPSSTNFLEARVGIEPTHKGFADLSLTTWVPRPGLHTGPTHRSLRGAGHPIVTGCVLR